MSAVDAGTSRSSHATAAIEDRSASSISISGVAWITEKTSGVRVSGSPILGGAMVYRGRGGSGGNGGNSSRLGGRGRVGVELEEA